MIALGSHRGRVLICVRSEMRAANERCPGFISIKPCVQRARGLSAPRMTCSPCLHDHNHTVHAIRSMTRVLHVHTSMPASKQMTSIVYHAKAHGERGVGFSLNREIAKPAKLSNFSTTVCFGPSLSVASADWSTDCLPQRRA